MADVPSNARDRVRLAAGLALSTCVPGAGVLAQGAAQGGGYQALRHRVASGSVLVTRSAGSASARAMARQASQGLAPFFDRAPVVVAGVANQEDSAAMLTLLGHQRGVFVQSQWVMESSPAGHVAVAVVDTPARLRATGAQLFAEAQAWAGAGAGGQASPSPYQNLQWTQQRYSKGTIALPAGWRVVGDINGVVDVVGTNGEVAGLGFYVQVATPQLAEQWRRSGIQNRLPVGPANGDPIQAYRTIQPQMEQFTLRNGGATVRLTRIVEAERIAPLAAGMNAALVLSDAAGNVPYRKFSLVGAGQMMANGMWMYYSSEVYAPTAIFAHALPVLLKVWNSWTIDKSVLMERMAAAARTMRETNEILSGINQNRQQSQERISQAWGHYIRGTVVVEDTKYGTRSTEWLYQPGPAASGIGTEHNRHMDDVIRELNRGAGYERWRPIDPLRRG